MYQKEFDYKNDNTADDGYRKKTGAEQGGHDTGNEGQGARNGGLGRIHDGRERHYRKCDVRNIVKERLQELALIRRSISY